MNKARFLRLHASLREALDRFVWEPRGPRALEMYRATTRGAVLEFCARNPDAAGTLRLGADELPPLPIEFCTVFGCQAVMLFPADFRWIVHGGDEDWDTMAFGVPSYPQP